MTRPGRGHWPPASVWNRAPRLKESLRRNMVAGVLRDEHPFILGVGVSDFEFGIALWSLSVMPTLWEPLSTCVLDKIQKAKRQGTLKRNR